VSYLPSCVPFRMNRRLEESHPDSTAALCSEKKFYFSCLVLRGCAFVMPSLLKYKTYFEIEKFEM